MKKEKDNVLMSVSSVEVVAKERRVAFQLENSKSTKKMKLKNLRKLKNAIWATTIEDSDFVELMDVSTTRLLELAEQGNLCEFQRLIAKDKSKMILKDNRGRQPLHCAALRNRVVIIEYIIREGGDLNCQDDAGNTPLQLAVETEAIEAIEMLLNNGADSSIQNNKSQAPIHYAVEYNRIEALKVLVKHKDKVDVVQRGEHGRTALHLAAIYDYAECAEVILKDQKKCIKIVCNNGYYPIHEAAKNASASTLEVILRWGESIGCTRDSMMKFYDAEGNDPLHSAVNGGDIKAVQLCLERGARINSQQHDLSTPVHLACSQGALSIIRLMFTLQPDEKTLCLSIGDAQKMTPLHCAAMFDHKDIVEYLVHEGAPVNSLDMQHRSPLLLAASRGGWKSVEVLMRLNADITIKDNCNRNVLHFIVMNGGRLEHFAPEICKSLDSLDLLLDHKDSHGCTPMHYASRNGHCKSLENLIRLGARINLKNNDNQSPLHFAARYGRFNTAVKLLESDKGPFIINETDGEGETPLHIASLFGHTKVVKLLLARGALLHRDHNGRTPLHLAAINGYTETMELLLSFHSHLLNQVDKDGNTALHLTAANNKATAISFLVSSNCTFVKNNFNATALDIAIQMKNSDAALAMVGHEKRGFAILHINSEVHKCIISALIIHLPDVYMGVLDRSITQSIRYNFMPLVCRLPDANRKYPLAAMNTMVDHGRVELLTHPMCQKYMEMKWNAYGMYTHLANLFIYIIFTLTFTLFVATRVEPLRATLHNMTDAEPSQQVGKVDADTWCYVITAAVFVFITFNVIKELFQIYQQRLRYMFDLINFFEWTLYVTSIISICPVLTGEIRTYQISCSAIAVFLAWFNFLISLQRFDLVGIYVVMFLEILNTLLKGNQVAFYSVPMSLVRVFSMMLGDLDFTGTYVNSFYRNQIPHLNCTGSFRSLCPMDNELPPPTLPFPFITFTMLVVFMVLMPILLMNLLIGLAVGDIEAVRRNAQLKRIAKQVELHSELERKLPQFLLHRGNQQEVLEYPNKPCCSHSFFYVVIQKITGNIIHFSVSPNMDNRCDEDFLYEEIEKQKKRLKEISNNLCRQHQLLTLIVQKMEIRTEADDFDEGGTHAGQRHASDDEESKWKSPTYRRKIRSANPQK
ncbi:hypothetical protein CHUAL_006421 [Chamberlinius hualienensis]